MKQDNIWMFKDFALTKQSIVPIALSVKQTFKILLFF